MSKLHLLSAKERQLFFDTAVTESGIALPILEKDFWVVWTLERLFSLEDLNGHLTFKGGTSLSKVYNIIQRFSEDLDLSIEKNFLGFDKERDPEIAQSKKKRRLAVEALAKSCAEYVQNKMLNDLRSNITRSLGTTEGWTLTIDDKDSSGQTMLFNYPRIESKVDYIDPSVRIEMGARSEHWPVSFHEIQSYLKETLKDKVTESRVRIRVLNVERTFWEKATILHKYAHFPEVKVPLPRISRHYYDFFCLLNSEIKKLAYPDHGLLERVATHKSIYFASAWANYDTARKGSLKLLPAKNINKGLEDDYALMKQMFFGDIPEWQLILKTIEEFEVEYNHS